MRKTWIGAAAAATVALTGFAFAQERQPGQDQKPAAGQTERSKAGERATEKEGAAAQAQGQMGEERHNGVGAAATSQERAGAEGAQSSREAQGQSQGQAGAKQNEQRRGEAGPMQKGQREGEARTPQNNQRQGEARSSETQLQKEQSGQAGQAERGGNAHEPGKASAESRNKNEPGQNREGQRAGETNRTEKGQAAQTQRGAQGAQGAGGEERTGAAQPNREGAGQTATTRNHEGKTQEGQTSAAGGTNASGAGTVEARGNAHISNEKASRIADTLWSTASPAQTSVNINVDVGEPLPGNVELMPLPPAVVELVPEYRGYEYVVVHDEIVIVQPSTRKVVEVIRRGGGEHAMREGGGRGHRLTLSEQQQRLIRETVRGEHVREEPVQEQLTYGVMVPQDVTLEPVPQPLVTEIPMIEQYRMFVANGDRIVLVDPDTREVVDVIE